MTQPSLVTRLCVVLGLALALAGCGSLPDRVTERFTPVPPEARVFAADLKTTFPAAQTALKQMEFTLTRTAQAQGIVEGISARLDSAVYGASRQLTMEIRLRELADGQTEVSVLAREQKEGDFKAGATSVALRGGGIYETYFANLAGVLKTAVPEATVGLPAR